MKIEITNSGTKTHISVDGQDVSKSISSFTLTQAAGELPTLYLKIPVAQGIDIDIPDGVVIASEEEVSSVVTKMGELARKSL